MQQTKISYRLIRRHHFAASTLIAEGLSLRALGLFLYLFYLPPDYSFDLDELAAACPKDSKGLIGQALEELKCERYVVEVQHEA